PHASPNDLEIRVTWIWGSEAWQARTVSEFLRNTDTIERRKTNGTAKDDGFSTSWSVVVLRLSSYGSGK
ncbi:MAG: hypothetical protein WAR24_16375, partial [Candidatus Acidiferrales bacterium]